MLFGLWFTPVLLHRIGSSDFGLWAAGMPILVYVALVDFGVLTIFQRDVAFALGEAQGEPANIVLLPSMVGATLRLVLLQMPFLLAAVVIAWVCLPARWNALHIPLAITLSCLVVTFPFRLYHALLAGLQELRFLGTLSIVTWGLGAVASATLVFAGCRLNALAISWSMSQLVMYGGCFLRVRSRFPRAIAGGLPPLTRTEAKAKLGKGFWVIVSQVAVTMAAGTDLVVIAARLGPSMVTPYTITDKLVTMANNLPLMILAAAQPALSELSTSGARERLSNVCFGLTRAVLLVSGLIATVVVIVDQGFVDWWIGPSEFGGRALVFLLVADMLTGHWTAATIYALFSFGNERLISVISVTGGILTLGATILLVGRLGPMGAPLAAIIVRALVTLPVLLSATSRAIGGQVGSLLWSVISLFWRLCLLLGAGVLATRSWIPRTVLQLSVAGTAAVLVYAVVMSPLAFSGPLGVYTRPRFIALRRWLGRGLARPG
jgi:O-antigen/teichoic acid export membrane protein